MSTATSERRRSEVMSGTDRATKELGR